MGRYEQHLQEAQKALQQAQTRPPIPTILTKSSKPHGPATNSHRPWRDDPGWREYESWKIESIRLNVWEGMHGR